MTAVEVKARGPKCTWELVGIYGDPNDDTRVVKRSAARTGYIGNSTKRSITGRD
jgi:hypothetical protein